MNRAPSPPSAISVFIVCSQRTGDTICFTSRSLIDATSVCGLAVTFEYTVVVGNRFLVEVDGHGVDMPTMKKAMEQINLAKLESMKDVGVAK